MHNLRRVDRALDIETGKETLMKGEFGFLATADNENQPYGVPVNYVYYNDYIYIHCAFKGHKITNITQNSQVSFTVVGFSQVLPEKMTSLYSSVIVFGKAELVDDEEKYKALIALADKYAPQFPEIGKEHIARSGKATAVIKITINSITTKGKIKQ